MSHSRSHPAGEGVQSRQDRDRRRQETLRSGTPSPVADLARELFFEHFSALERTAQRILCRHGFEYDAHTAHYNTVFDLIYHRVYAPEALPDAVERFDPDRGPLFGWMLRRVDYEVRNWASRHAGERSTEFVGSIMPPVDPDTTFPNAETPVFDRALAGMTAAQRACTVLRVLPVRDPTPDDLDAIFQTAAKPADVMLPRLAEAAARNQGGELGIRQQDLLDEMARCHALREHHGRRERYFRTQLAVEGLTDSDLEELRLRALAESQREILLRYQPPPGRRLGRIDRLKKVFEWSCHEARRLAGRLERLADELAGAEVVPLLSYQQIADLLGTTVARVNSCLHRARERIEVETVRRRDPADPPTPNESDP